MQLDLFDRKAAEVIPLPSARIGNRVRATAVKLLGMSKNAGRRYWQQHAAEIRRSRKAQGFTAKEIDAELDAYARAISIEIDIHEYYRSAPDGAA